MSGVVACCCDAIGGGPTTCQCQCICDHYFSAFSQDFQDVYIGLWVRPGGFVGGPEWTLIWWTNECGTYTETDTHFHQYRQPWQPSEKHIRVYLSTLPDDPANTLVQEMQLRIYRDDFTFWGTLSIQVKYPGGIGGCKMRVVRYREILDVDTGFMKPAIGTSIYVDDSVVEYKNTIDAFGPDANIGFNPPFANYETFITGHFPLDDVRYNPAFKPTGACISNIQTFSEWLDDSTLTSLWNLGKGHAPEDIIKMDENEDQWCAGDPNWQQIIGAKAGLVIKHHGALWANNASKIQDGNGNFIHGIS